MKNLNRFIIFFIVVLAFSCGDKLAYDFAAVDSSKALDSLLTVLKEKEVEMDSSVYSNTITGAGMHYAGVPIKEALLYENSMLLTTDTLDFHGKKLLEALEAKNGFGKLDESYVDTYNFSWKKENAETELNLNMVNGKHLANIGNKDKGALEIRFKTVYDIPLANIHHKISKFEKEPIYRLNVNCYSCDYTVFMNDINLTNGSNSKDIILNAFIIENQSATIRIETRANARSRDREFNSLDASIVESPESFEISFNPQLPELVKGWTNGADLRKDPTLKEKIIKLYEQIATAILANDASQINAMFYDYRFETHQAIFDDDFSTSREFWEFLLELQAKAHSFHIEKDFEIEFNANGRLIIALPKKKSDMLIFTGKRFSKTMNYFMYQPKGSTDLKIIR